MYRSDFLEANKRNSRLGLKELPINLDEKRYLNDQSLLKVAGQIYQVFGELNENEIIAQCLSLHLRLKPILENALGCDVYYTIGWIDFGSSTMFKQTEDGLLETLKNGISGDDVNIHAWLTLPSLEILDFSLPTTYAKVNNLKEGAGQAITKHYSELTGGMSYHPMVLGSDFLFKSGLAKVSAFNI